MGGGCGALLLEKQSTNVALYSEQFNNAAWVSLGGSITANYGISPDGTQNADRFQGSSSARQGNYQTISVSNGATYTLSMYVKSLSGTQKIRIGADTGCVNPQGAQTFTFGETWTRITTTFASTQTSWNIYFDNIESGMACSGTTLTIDCLMWGFQVEQSSYATSYISTTSASSTRIADACYKTGISNLIGQTEGTMYGEIQVITGVATMAGWMRKLSGGVYGDIILAYVDNNGFPSAGIDVGGVNQVAIAGTTPLSAGYHKIAFAYKQNDFVLYADGVQVASDSSGSVPTCDELYIDKYIDGGDRNATKKEFILYKTRLTNAELATLTTI